VNKETENGSSYIAYNRFLKQNWNAYVSLWLPAICGPQETEAQREIHVDYISGVAEATCKYQG